MDTLLETIKEDPDIQLRIILHFLPQAKIKTAFKVRYEDAEPGCRLVYADGYFRIHGLSDSEETMNCLELAQTMLRTDFLRTMNYIENHILLTTEYELFNGLGKDHYRPIDLGRMIRSLKDNPKEYAKRFLRSRHIDLTCLTEDSFYGNCSKDGSFDAIVFVDSEDHFLQKQFFSPMAGSPTHLNLGQLKNALYDKVYRGESDSVYLTNSVIDALSLQPCSSISIFSPNNHFTNAFKLGWYLRNKQVIIAFGNHSIGNSCARYYQSFIMANIPVKSIKRLILPEGFDLNDLLMNRKLDTYLSVPGHYSDLRE